MIKVEFVICVEQGYLEKQAKLLIYTLRNYGGIYARHKITAYQPRKKYPVSSGTLKFFETNEVEFVDSYLNRQYAEYPLGNKPVIFAYHEQRVTNANLIYLDCDFFFYNEPEKFGKVGINEISARPEDAKGAGTSFDFNDDQSVRWKEFYALLGIQHKLNPVFTVLDYQCVQPYFNAGLFEVNSETGFAQQWIQNMDLLLGKKMIPPHQLLMAEQMAFSLTVSQMKLRVKYWDVEYNFPTNLFLYNDIKHPAYAEASFEEACVLHYHKIFLRPDGAWEEWLGQTPKGRDILKKIAEYGLRTKTKSTLRTRMRRKLDNYRFYKKYSGTIDQPIRTS